MVRNGCVKSSWRLAHSLGGAGADASLVKDTSEDMAKVERDVKEVAVSLLANQTQNVGFDQKSRILTDNERILMAGSHRTGQTLA